MKKPRLRLSVVIPVYERQHAFNLALRSLEPDADLIDEIVVVDDASPTPVTIEYSGKLANKIRLIRQPSNMGSSVTRQRAIAESTGDLVAFLDSDDMWLPGKLSAQLAHFKSQEDLLAVSIGFQVDDVQKGYSWCRYPMASSNKTDFAAGCWFCPGSTVVITRKALDVVGSMDPRLRRLEDLDWYLRFAIAGGRLEVARGLGVIIAKSRYQRSAHVRDAARIILNKAYCPPDDSAYPIIKRHLSAWLDIEVAAAGWHAGDRIGALLFAARSILKKPRFGVQLKKWWRVTKASDIATAAKQKLETGQ